MGAAAPVRENPPPPAPRRRRRWGHYLLAVVAVLLLLVAAFAAWLVTTPGGARLALDQATRMAGGGITYEGLEGSLGGPMSIDVVEIDRPDLYARIEGLEIDASPREALGGRLRVHHLRAKSVELRTVDKGEPARLPESVAPPFPVTLEEGRIGELRMGDLPAAARNETDPARKRSLIAAARTDDLLVRDILVRGAGDHERWRIDEARAATELGRGRVAGTLGTGAPFPLDAHLGVEGKAGDRAFRADADAKGTLRSLEAALRGEVSGQPATGRVVVEPFGAMPLRALEVQAHDVDLSRHVEGAPATRLEVAVDLDAAGPGAFAGPVRIGNAEPGPWDQGRLPFETASARVVARADQLDIADLAVALSGGGFAGGRAVVREAGIEADLAVKDVDLAALHGELQKTRITGRVSASGDRAAQRFEVNLREPRFSIDGQGVLADGRLDVKDATVRTGGGSVTATGHVALEGPRPFRFEGRARHFDPSAFVKAAKGDLNFAFVASGALGEGIAGDAKLDISPSTYAGLPVSGRVAVAGDAKRIARADVDLALGEARVQAKGSFGRAGDALDVAFRAPDLARLARPFGVALAGSAEGDARLTGTFASPAGRVAVKGANLALPANVFVRELSARVEAGVEPSSRIDGTVSARGIAVGEERPPTPLAQSFEASLRGTRAQHRLEASAVMRRDTTVRAAFAGGLDPRARAPAWKGRVESLAMTGRGAFALDEPAPLEVSASRVELGAALLRGQWGEARLEVTRWTPRTLDLKGATAGVQIQNLARSLRLGTVPRSNLVLAGDWDIRAAERFDGTVNLRRVSGDLRVGEPPLPLGLEALDVRIDAVAGRLKAVLAIAGERAGRIQGEATGLVARGKGGWEFAADAPLQGRFTAEHTNLAVFTPWLGPDSRLGGQLNASVTLSGTGAEPRVSGVARATELAAREPQSGFELENGTVAVRLDGSKVTIETFEATTPWRPPKAALARMRRVEAPAGGGRITGEGSLDLAARTGAIRVRADKVPVTQIPTRFVAMSGEARLQAKPDGLLAAGGFTVDAGWIGAPDEAMPTPSEDVVVVRAEQPAPEPAPQPQETVRLDMRFGLGERLYFQGLGLDTRLAGEVHLTGAVGSSLQAKGVIRTVGGTYDGYGQKLSIERGVLTLDGPLDNPQLNVLALRKGLPVEAGVEVLGTLVRPKVRLVSVPEVPEPEKLSWLVLGRGAADASLGDSAVMMAAAQALLGGNNPGEDLTKRLGFDEFKIGRADANSVLGVLPQSTVAGRTGSPSAAEVVSVGKRLNRGLHLTYEQGLADAEGALKLTWRITRQFQVLARAGYLPGLDAVYRWTFD